MSKYVTKDWKKKGGLCENCEQNQVQINYENRLMKFPKGAIFMQVTDWLKGYIYVLPEYEDLFIREFKDLAEEMLRYDCEKPIDKCIDNADYDGYVQYAYLSLYDSDIFDDNLGDENRTCRRCKMARKQSEEDWELIPIFYAFRSLDLVVYDKLFLYLKSLHADGIE